MKKFQLSDEEKIALLEKIKSYPRPKNFAKTQPEVVEEDMMEDVPVEEITVAGEPSISSKKSKKSKK